MSNALDRAATPAPQSAALNEALDEVLHHLSSGLKPKARNRAKAKLEAFATRLETWQGRQLPANVTPLRGRLIDADQENHRRERAERAAAIRHLIGRAF